MFILKAIPFKKIQKFKNQLWYMFRNFTFYEILEKRLQNPKKLSDGKNVLSFGYNIRRHFWTVMVTNLSQLLIGKYLLLNILLNLLF